MAVEMNAMDNLTSKDRFKCRFDFEIGYLVKRRLLKWGVKNQKLSESRA
jgi:hypothetical protein